MPWACSRDGHGGTLQGHWHWVGRQHRAAFVRFWVGGGSKRQLVRTGFWRQIGAGARRGAGLRDLAYRVSKLFSQHCVRLVALRKPVLWTARAARRPFLFWIGLRARSGCAGPLGPRPLAPPRLCTPRRASGMMAASRGPSGPLRGSPLPRGRTAGWFAPT